MLRISAHAYEHGVVYARATSSILVTSSHERTSRIIKIYQVTKSDLVWDADVRSKCSTVSTYEYVLGLEPLETLERL